MEVILVGVILVEVILVINVFFSVYYFFLMILSYVLAYTQHLLMCNIYIYFMNFFNLAEL